jgi:hypothetical protein
MLAVVAGVAAPQEVTHSARYNCPACGSSVDVLAAQQYLPCCNMLKSPTCEDLTGRWDVCTFLQYRLQHRKHVVQ